VLADVPVGLNGSHIDHLVIGPGGIYTLSAKGHPDARVWVRGDIFRVDGAPYAYVSNSRHEALRASRYLSAACGFKVAVTGLVIVFDAEEIVVRQAPGDVEVLTQTAVRAWFRRRGDVLDGPTIEAVHDAARRSTTWAPPA
jgi:hypothetical protein